MRYVKGHGLQTRSRIVEEASYGLRQRGADGMSVVDLMKLAGLTMAASTRISIRAKHSSSRRLRSPWIAPRQGIAIIRRSRDDRYLAQDGLQPVLRQLRHRGAGR